MAVVNGINYAKTIAVPVEKIDPGLVNGRVKVLNEKYTLSAAVAATDEINGPYLPEGAKVIYAQATIANMGGTGIFSIGHRASVDYDGAILAQDADAFIAVVDGGAGRSSAVMTTEVGANLRFGAETQVYALCTEITVATTGSIEWNILYTLD